MINIINNIHKTDSPHHRKRNGKIKNVNYRYWVVYIKVEILTVCIFYHKIVIMTH